MRDPELVARASFGFEPPVTLASVRVGDRIGRLALLELARWRSAATARGARPPGRRGRARSWSCGGWWWSPSRRAVGEVGGRPSSPRRRERRSARTAASYLPTPTAVLFADAAELLACYLLSLRRADVAPEWVWAQVAGSLPPPALTAVLRDRSTHVCAVVAVLDGWHRLDEAFGGLDMAGALRVVEAVAERHALWVRAIEAPGARPAGSTYTSGEERPAARASSSGLGARAARQRRRARG